MYLCSMVVFGSGESLVDEVDAKVSQTLSGRSYSRLMAFEASRILHHLGCDVRVFDPSGLPMKDEASTMHPKVQELRDLTTWSQAHFWCSPEQHGNITAVMKNQSECLSRRDGLRKNTEKPCLLSALDL